MLNVYFLRLTWRRSTVWDHFEGAKHSQSGMFASAEKNKNRWHQRKANDDRKQHDFLVSLPLFLSPAFRDYPLRAPRCGSLTPCPQCMAAVPKCVWLCGTKGRPLMDVTPKLARSAHTAYCVAGKHVEMKKIKLGVPGNVTHFAWAHRWRL